jgi:hypothetical protein
MGKEPLLCKTFLLRADWDEALAAFPEKDDGLSSEDFANRAYVRCFQATKDHKDGKYDDVIADASKALAKDCLNNHALCIRAYGYYLNNNYEAAIADCERIIEGISGDIEKEKQNMKKLLADACKKMAAVVKAKEAAEKAVETAEKKQKNHCKKLHDFVFAYELLGLIYKNIDWSRDSSWNYKQALLYRQTDIVAASPLLMDAYRNACAGVKSV